MATALLLGVRDDLDRGHREMFICSGTMHLLAISGLHVGLLAGLVWLLTRLLRLGRTIADLRAGNRIEEVDMIEALSLRGPGWS